MNRHRIHLLLPTVLTLALGLSGCGKSGDQGTAAVPSAPSASARPETTAPGAFPGMEADLRKTIKAQPDFYVFKTAADFATDTAGLQWKDGSDLPEFSDPAAKRGGTLRLQIPDYPRMFRTIGPDANDAFRAYTLDYNELVVIRPHPGVPGRYYPELARAWAVDAAHNTVYFRLDPAARWSDGVPVTTDDVVFSWYFYRSPVLDEPWYNDFYTKTYKRITVYGPHDYSVTLPEMRPDIEDRAGDVTLYPKHFFRDFGPHWEDAYNWRVVPTTGPYTIRNEDVKKQISVTLSRVPGWWASDKRFIRHRFNPDRVRLVVIRDPDKAIESFLRGDLDVSPVNMLLNSTVWYDKVSENKPAVADGYVVKATFYNRIPCPDSGLWINESRPLLSDVNVRLGIQYASNFDLVAKEYFRGDAVRQQTRSDGYGWRMNPDISARPFDPAKAREFFAKAGFVQQGPDGVLVNDKGQRLSFTITSYARAAQDELVILKQDALKAGLEFTIEILDPTTGWKKMQEKHHDIALAALNRSVEMYPRYWEMFAGDNAYEVPYLADGSPNPARQVKPYTNNMTETANPELDRLIHLYDHAVSMEDVKSLASRIERIIYDDASWVNGVKEPFYRLAYWRWVKWPPAFNAMQSRDQEEFWLMWIDQDAQKEALQARSDGRTFPKQVLTFDEYKGD